MTRYKTLAVLAFYFFLAVVLTYPLALHLGTHIPGHDTDGPAQTWSLWWTRFALLDLGRAPFTTDYLFYPLGLNLVAYTPVFLNGLLSIPLQLAFGVIVAQNAMVYFALVTGAYGAYLFVRECLAPVGSAMSAAANERYSERSVRNERRFVPMAGDGTLHVGNERRFIPAAEGTLRRAFHTELAAVLAGAVYGFGAWHLNYVVAGHFMLISNQWLPYYALYLVRLEKGWRNAVMLGLFLILTAWTELTFVPFLALLTIFYLAYLLVARRGALKQYILGLVLTSVIGLVGTSPLVFSLAADFQRYGYYLTEGVGRIQIFSAEPISFFLPSGQHPLLGAWSESITTANTSYAFIGWAVLVLAALGVYANRKNAFAWFWASAALVFALLMFGSTLYVNGENTNLPMPFALLRVIPFVNANRYPARFNLMLMLSLAPLMAWGAMLLLNARAVWAKIAFAALGALLVFEQLVLPIPLTEIRVPALFETIRAMRGDFSVLEIPLGWRGSIVMQGKTDDAAQFYQTLDHKRRLGGITSRFPAFKLRYFADAPVLSSLIALEEGRAVDEQQIARDRELAAEVLRFFDIRFVVLNRAETSDAVMDYVRAVLPLTVISRDATRTLYRVDLPPPPMRWAIDPGAENAQLLFDDGWGRAQEDNAGFGFRWATESNARAMLPLENKNYEITFRLRGARAQQKIELRVNDVNVAEWNITDAWGEYKAQIPSGALREGLDELVFVTETTVLDQAARDDRTIGGTGVVAPVDIVATGAGFDAGKFGEIFVAGQNWIPSTRGYQLVAIHAQTGNVDAVGSFDTFADKDASRRLVEFVAALPQGEIVAGVAIDDASNALSDKAFAALQTLGVAGDVRAQFRAGHAFVGIQGIAPGQAVEDLQARLPANIAIGKNVSKPRVSFALGPFEIVGE
ncbi:MAG: hypothetical protein HY741_17965 [Chloroflexi bacterium]|nr:hypothetical protein [Chloroflexota bacterium]